MNDIRINNLISRVLVEKGLADHVRRAAPTAEPTPMPRPAEPAPTPVAPVKVKAQSPDLIQAVYDRIDHLLTLPICQGVPRPPIRFKKRGTTAGTAHPRNGLNFNPILLQENGQDFVDDTPGHELAHWICYHRYPIRVQPHGREWKSVMRALGQNPTRCHTFNVDNARVRRVARPYAYECDCYGSKGIHHLTANIHNKIQRGQVRICKRCKARIRFVQKNR